MINKANNKDYAHPVLRLLAQIFDLLLFWTIFVVGVYYLSASTNVYSLLDRALMVVLLLLLSGVFMNIVISYMESMLGGTFGKLIFGLRIIDSGSNFLTFRMALFRNYIAKSVSGLLFGAGYLWIIKDSDRQGWHDMIVDSYVINKNRNYIYFGLISTIILLVLLLLLISSTLNMFTSKWEFFSRLFV